MPLSSHYFVDNSIRSDGDTKKKMSVFKFHSRKKSQTAAAHIICSNNIHTL